MRCSNQHEVKSVVLHGAVPMPFACLGRGLWLEVENQLGNRIIQSFQPLASYVYFQEFHRYLFFLRSPSFSVSPLNFISDYLEFKTNLKVKEDIFTLLVTLLKTDKETYFITWGFKLVFLFIFWLFYFQVVTHCRRGILYRLSAMFVE